MKNIFDYATKELSQDAFLRWFLESDIDDSGKKLLSAFTGLESNKISNIHTKAQIKKIDILVEFIYENKECVLIIEDKIESNQHDNQLNRYSEIVKKKYENANQYFVYYKPRFLNDEEPINNEWIGFGLERIHNFFSQYLHHTNLIIHSYALYIDAIYKKMTTTSTLPISEWDYLDALSFFENKVEKIFRKYHVGEKASEKKIYQGHYASNKIYFSFKNEKLYRKVYPLIEFVFRKNNDYINLYAHICFRKDDVWSWKWCKETNDLSNKEFVKQIREVFIKSGFKKRGNLDNERTQTFGVSKLSKNQSLENLEQDIEKIIKSFVEFFKEFENNY
jgi:hypothetical protein